jgi:hypothetical protein
MKSGKKIIEIGVPQGSVLGPILFLIYINDLPNLKLRGIPFLFADDTGIFYFGKSIENLQTLMQQDLKKLNEWFCNNLLTVNKDKTVYIIFHKPQSNLSLESIRLVLDNQELCRVEKTTYLGIILDQHLNWESQVISVKNKIARISGVLYRLKTPLNLEHKKTIYHALINSHLMYMNFIWGCCKEGLLKILQTAQNTAIKRLFGFHQLESTAVIYQQTGLLPLKNIIAQSSAMYMFKLLNNYSTGNTTFTLNKEIHNYQTREANNIRHEKIKTTKYGSRSIRTSMSKAYNALTPELKSSPTLQCFKKNLKIFHTKNLLLL